VPQQIPRLSRGVGNQTEVTVAPRVAEVEVTSVSVGALMVGRASQRQIVPSQLLPLLHSAVADTLASSTAL